MANLRELYPAPTGATGATGSVSAATGVTLEHIATPSAPAAGNTIVYGKSDGKIYKRPAGGSEEEIGSGGREVLTADRTYYVRTDGSDSNNGLTNTAGGAFLTPQEYYDIVATLDKNGYNVTGKLADGTYTITTAIIAKSGIGDGTVTLEGNTTTPANVVITTSTDLTTDKGMLYFDLQNNLHILKGFKLTSTPSVNQRGIYVRAGSKVEYTTLDFGSISGTFSNHLRVDSGGSVVCTGNYTISGGAGSHWFTSLLGNLLCASRTITITGTPVFTGDAFCSATRQSVCQVNANTFSGSATGKRHSAVELSLIFTNAGTLPGDVAGTTATGGQYV